MKKVLKIIGILIFVLFVIVLFSIMYQKYVKKNLVVRIFGYSRLVVLTGSMAPTIEEGEGIIIKKEKNYNIDDIITFNIDNKYLVTHRIVDIKEENGKRTYKTKGDFNNFEDIDELYDENIEGKVIFSSKLLGLGI